MPAVTTNDNASHNSQKGEIGAKSMTFVITLFLHPSPFESYCPCFYTPLQEIEKWILLKQLDDEVTPHQCYLHNIISFYLNVTANNRLYYFASQHHLLCLNAMQGFTDYSVAGLMI